MLLPSGEGTLLVGLPRRRGLHCSCCYAHSHIPSHRVRGPWREINKTVQGKALEPGGGWSSHCAIILDGGYCGHRNANGRLS